MKPKLLAQAFSEYDGPGELYRVAYKYTACGPSVGLRISRGPEQENLYCSELYKLGTWEDMEKAGIDVQAIYVGSIVEGVDFDCQTIEIDVTNMEVDDVHKKFDEAVEEVNSEADYIWNQTHGCERCAKELGEKSGEWGHTAVWADCPECNGHGVVI